MYFWLKLRLRIGSAIIGHRAWRYYLTMIAEGKTDGRVAKDWPSERTLEMSALVPHERFDLEDPEDPA